MVSTGQQVDAAAPVAEAAVALELAELVEAVEQSNSAEAGCNNRPQRHHKRQGPRSLFDTPDSMTHEQPVALGL